LRQWTNRHAQKPGGWVEIFLFLAFAFQEWNLQHQFGKGGTFRSKEKAAYPTAVGTVTAGEIRTRHLAMASPALNHTVHYCS